MSGSVKQIRVTVRVSRECGPEFDGLRNIINGVEVNTSKTWAEFFHQISNVRFATSSPYVVARVNLQLEFRLDQPISDILSGYTYKKEVYPLILKKESKTHLQPEPGLKSPRTATKRKRVVRRKKAKKQSKRKVSRAITTQALEQHNLPVFKMPPPGPLRLMTRSRRFVDETADVESFTTANPRIGSRRESSCSEYSDSGSDISLKYLSSWSPANRNENNILPDTLVTSEHNPLNESTMSTYSDIEEFMHENCKPDYVKRVIDKFSNQQLLLVHEELQQILLHGRWVKTTSIIPVTANFLMDIFRVNMPREPVVS